MFVPAVYVRTSRHSGQESLDIYTESWLNTTQQKDGDARDERHNQAERQRDYACIDCHFRPTNESAQLAMYGLRPGMLCTPPLALLFSLSLFFRNLSVQLLTKEPPAYTTGEAKRRTEVRKKQREREHERDGVLTMTGFLGSTVDFCSFESLADEEEEAADGSCLQILRRAMDRGVSFFAVKRRGSGGYLPSFF